MAGDENLTVKTCCQYTGDIRRKANVEFILYRHFLYFVFPKI